MIRNIIFDFGCVLVDLDKQRCVEAFRKIGAESISAYVDECRQEDLFHDLETGKTGIGEFCDEVRRKAPACTADNDTICDAWNSLLGGIPKRRIEKLVSLKERYRLFVLSNTNPIHWKKAADEYFPMDGMNVDDYFEKVFLSYRMHLIKPDTEIFIRTLAEAGIKAEETLFIDDSAANCRAAAALGISTMHVTCGDKWLDKI
ncbi:HAD family hydrolase [Xylanibacter caecicola]|uniref:HAD family hydrolase n=1 Tax=Xylanibacter caecicola TaxID=2736294 RepID=UPI00258CB28B|nr:HAD family phosphatase [Xylanibacter caecicola]